MDEVDEEVASARAAHQAGRLAEAEAGYLRVLARVPEQAEALHLLGVVHFQRGEAGAAVTLIRRAIAAGGGDYRPHHNLASALQATGRLPEALESARRAAALAPDVAAVGLALAGLLRRMERLEEAAEACRAVLALTPTDGAVHFALGSIRQTQGRLQDAEDSYRASLDHRQDDAPSLVNLGTVLHARGRLEAAAAAHRRATAVAPDFAPAHRNLGAVLQAQGRLFEAAKSYRRALTLAPKDADAHFALGTAAQAVGWLEEAERCYRDAARLAPDRAEPRNNLGQVLEAQGRLPDAVATLRQACALAPLNAAFHNNLACALYLLHRQQPERARAEAEAWLAGHPDQPIARHMAQALAGDGRPPPQPPAGYVRALFDGFAGSFERELLGIGYCGPQLMATAFSQRVPDPRGDLEVLDAGCGTGLCGPVLRPLARRLVGVDVSRAMLEHARDRGLYDQLVEAELTGFLAARLGRFDLICAADVLCYQGELEPVVAGFAAALRPQGALAFTVEQSPDASLPFRLEAHGRYLHGEQPLRALLTRHHLSVARLWVANLRDEDRRPSPNLAVLAVKG